jgi:two-component system, LytTR family, response regulator
MRLKVLVVDDEPLAREGLRRMLEGDPHVEAIGEARNGREALAAIRDQKPDLVLMDIQMPRMDGFAVMEAVIEAVGADRMPAVIFVTAYDQYAIRAFEISAVDYLLKPVTEERFRLAFQRVTKRLQSVSADEGTRQMLAVLDAIAHPPRRLTRLAVRSGEKTLFLPVDAIDRIEACQNYVQLRAGQTSHLLHVPMNTLEASLDPETFLRIHRSHIVNVKQIKQVWSVAHGQYVLELHSGERLHSGRTYGDRIRALLSNRF